MPLNFPSSPTNGQVFTSNGQSWIFDATDGVWNGVGGSGGELRFAQTIGNGSATSFNIDHNFDTLDVLVEVVRVSDGLTVIADVTRPTANRVTVAFAVAPTTNQYRVIVAS